ncbi:phosphoribosylamine--glycine ligase [Zunongwangia profunda]|uniref:Phosphoribosylamine--glycine ligase n=1 Tax=Zunongwangia profunda TaxID=398743 RepID=A0A3D5IYN6_9FLAO|nr:phosphoribosylamine--glycine ligase [Zunongwangia profunda]MAS70677.1 phosphoribosylamine--glycine ligase [Zunongwangia sp.]HCV80498.1 phosphoribosylamine--glycine ligase [Zunongwangia profunda]|tara:strand:- start:1458 stop:2738 length:1281 start_codon:yes stop_codon:yes gene_type:complete
MKILILGSGGREHTFAYKIAQSPKCEKLYIAPGNAGTLNVGENVSLNVGDFSGIKDFIIEKNVDMLVVGPEDPLVKGITDFCKGEPDLKDLLIVGPSKRGALLEGSKERAKEFMAMYQIPTAAYESFTIESLEAGKTFLETLSAPYVLKADGLAAGKGVLILNDLAEAKTELENMLKNQKFGEASAKVVIEEFLDGIELSVFVLTDGKNYKILPTAKDYKRIGEGDTGLNTGGMGAISPVPFADAELMQKIEERIVKPTVNGLTEENIDYKGFIFIGLIKVGKEPYVIEYNVRMGDPETEVVLPRVKSDLVEVLAKTAEGKLNEVDLEIDERAATTVMMVSGGYPEAYEKAKEITGIENVNVEDALVFHAGTTLKDGKVVTNGGRVIAVTAFGEDYKQALKKSYQNVEKLQFDKMYFRKDLGFDLA